MFALQSPRSKVLSLSHGAELLFNFDHLDALAGGLIRSADDAPS